MEENQEQTPEDGQIPQNRRGTCQKGFFVLRKCDKPAIAKCALSRQYICEDCAVQYEGRTVSRDAYAQEMKRLNRPKPQAPNKIDTWRDDDGYDYALWYYYMREDFYTQNNYRPFNDFDGSAFNDSGDFGGGEFGGAGASGAWDDESGAGGFYDS